MRKKVREFNLKFLFSYVDNQDFGVEDIEKRYEDLKETMETGLTPEEYQYFYAIVSGTIENFSKINDKVDSYLKKSRLNPTDKAILLLSFYELGHYKQTPKNVVINEAVELSKKYGQKESSSLINALLDQYSKSELE
jgi:N utilization substance protein B